jgi:2-iminoacetate synthase
MTVDIQEWKKNKIKEDQITRYLNKDGTDFINDESIEKELKSNSDVDASRVREIIAKSMEINTLTLQETATLLNVTDPQLWQEMEVAAGAIKRKVYDNRIVTFAPLYLSTTCVNNCVYCGFRESNKAIRRGVLSMDEVRKEVEVLAGTIGHKRLIVVYGEHPESDTQYMMDTLRVIYDVKIPLSSGAYGAIRRVNVNGAPLSIEDFRSLNEVGIGTYQIFQETYHKKTYKAVHSANTLKGNYRWRLYAMHRALEAGVDDVGIGAFWACMIGSLRLWGCLHMQLNWKASSESVLIRFLFPESNRQKILHLSLI